MLKNKSFAFVANLKKFLLISGILLLAGLICTLVFGPVLDISFQGGTKISYSFTGELDTDAVRKFADETLSKKTAVAITAGVADSSQKLIVSLADNQALNTESIDALTKALTEKYPDNAIEQAEVNSVNPSVGTVFFLKCLVAVLIAAVLVIVYVDRPAARRADRLLCGDRPAAEHRHQLHGRRDDPAGLLIEQHHRGL